MLWLQSPGEALVGSSHNHPSAILMPVKEYIKCIRILSNLLRSCGGPFGKINFFSSSDSNNGLLNFRQPVGKKPNGFGLRPDVRIIKRKA